VLALLAACDTTEPPVRYSPTVPVQAAAASRPVVAVSGQVVNERRDDREDPTWIGTIRRGYGSPMKVLKADQPVDRVVVRAFEDGLAARGLLAPGGASPYLLAVTIHQLDANQYARREATADFGAVLTERASGRAVWRGRRKAYKVDGSLVTLNAFAFASVDDFRRTAVSAISEGGDALRDDPGFRTTLRRG
jgi:hypothetical protein